MVLEIIPDGEVKEVAKLCGRLAAVDVVPLREKELCCSPVISVLIIVLLCRTFHTFFIYKQESKQ